MVSEMGWGPGDVLLVSAHTCVAEGCVPERWSKKRAVTMRAVSLPSASSGTS